MKIGNITLQDKDGEQYTVSVPGCSSAAALLSIVDFLKAYSDAEVIAHEFIEREEQSIPENKQWPDHAYDTVDQQNSFIFLDEYGYVRRFSIPAPTENTLSEDQQATAEIAGELKELLINTCKYQELLYKGGGLISALDSE